MAVVTTANKLVSDPPAGEIDEIEDFVDRQFRSFKNFDVAASPPSDHHFVNLQTDIAAASFVCIKNFRSPLTRGGGGGDAARKERIKKEWELLGTSLPNSIFVRAYSTRPELMRAAVIGLRHNDDSNNTNPYGYGLFFFDIMLPAQYPAKPPQIYHQRGRVGCELVHADRVERNISCFGEDGEDSDARWNPERSSVMHTLGVIQRSVVARGQ